MLDLNPCIKDEYFKAAWTAEGVTDASETMKKAVRLIGSAAATSSDHL